MAQKGGNFNSRWKIRPWTHFHCNNIKLWAVDFFLRKSFWRTSILLCGAGDTPVLDFWWHPPWASGPGWILSLACFVVCVQWNPQIHLWCDTCWPLFFLWGGGGVAWQTSKTSIGGDRCIIDVSSMYHAVDYFSFLEQFNTKRKLCDQSISKMQI